MPCWCRELRTADGGVRLPVSHLPNLQVRGCLAFLVLDERLDEGSQVRYLAAFEAARMMGFGVNWLFTDEDQDILRLGNCFAPLQLAVVWYKIIVGDAFTPVQSIQQVLFRLLLQGPLTPVMNARYFYIEDLLVRRLILASYLQGEQAVYVLFDPGVPVMSMPFSQHCHRDTSCWSSKS